MTATVINNVTNTQDLCFQTTDSLQATDFVYSNRSAALTTWQENGGKIVAATRYFDKENNDERRELLLKPWLDAAIESADVIYVYVNTSIDKNTVQWISDNYNRSSNDNLPRVIPVGITDWRAGMTAIVETFAAARTAATEMNVDVSKMKLVISSAENPPYPHLLNPLFDQLMKDTNSLAASPVLDIHPISDGLYLQSETHLPWESQFSIRNTFIVWNLDGVAKDITLVKECPGMEEWLIVNLSQAEQKKHFNVYLIGDENLSLCARHGWTAERFESQRTKPQREQQMMMDNATLYESHSAEKDSSDRCFRSQHVIFVSPHMDELKMLRCSHDHSMDNHVQTVEHFHQYRSVAA